MTCAMGGIPGGGVSFLPLLLERSELDPNDFLNVEGLKTPFCDIDAVLGAAVRRSVLELGRT